MKKPTPCLTDKCVCVCVCVWVCVCVGVCVCVCVCVCVHPFIVKASSVWNSWDCQETDQRCCVENVGFLCRFPSSPLWYAEHNLSASCFILFVHWKLVQPRLYQYTSRFHNRKLLIQSLEWLFHNFSETHHFTDHAKNSRENPFCNMRNFW